MTDIDSDSVYHSVLVGSCFGVCGLVHHSWLDLGEKSFSVRLLELACQRENGTDEIF